MISSIRQNTVKYQSNQQGLAKRRTLINALDTIDAQSGKYRAVADSAQRAYSMFPSLIAILPACIMAPIMSEKSGIKKLAMPALLLSVLSTISYGIFTKKRGENTYKTALVGQEEALKNNLSDTKLFLELDDKRIQEIEQNPYYRSILSMDSQADRSKIFLDYSFKEYKSFFNDIERKAKGVEYPDTPPSGNQFTKSIEFIDNRTRNYNNKIVAGMNILYSGFCAAGAGVGIALNALSKKYKKLSIPLNIGAFASILAPQFMLCKTTQKSFFSDIEQISRLKAKEDFLYGNFEDKNSVRTYLDYSKTKEQYINRLEKQEFVTEIRNNIIKNSKADEGEIAAAKSFQQEFNSAVSSRDRMNKLRKTELKNSFASDFLSNVAISAALYPILLAVNKQFGVISQKSWSSLKSVLLASLTTTVGCLMNASFAKLLNKDLND